MSIDRPPRTFGIAAALILSVLLFTVAPLMQLLWIVGLRARIAALDFGDEQPLFSGGTFTSVSDAELIVRAVLGGVFLVIAIIAWRGRPPQMRWIVIGSVIALTLVSLAFALAPLSAPPDWQQGFDSGADVVRGLLTTQLCITFAIPLYVVWYMLRAPARAFYRGYYLPVREQTA